MVSFISECNIGMYLETEKALFPELLVLGNLKYSLYLAYQHVVSEVDRMWNKSTWKDLK